MTLRLSDIGAGFAGLQTCGSVWVCPVCAPKILTHRALEIGAVLSRALAEGHGLVFFTLTMRHRKSQPLDRLWAAGAKAWQRAISGKYWMAERDASGVVGWVRVWEVTYGRNGHHVHVHGVLVLAPGSGMADMERVCQGMFRRWSKGLTDAGLQAPQLQGQDWHFVNGDQAADDLAGYLFKIVEQADADRATSLGLELTHSQPGRARSDLATKPMWSVLDDLVRDGEAESLRRWHEWERVSKGKRQVGFSKGLRDRFAPDVEELSDEAVADIEHGSAQDDVLHFGPEAWRMVVADPEMAPSILTMTEAFGVAGARRVLDQAQIPYAIVRPSACDVALDSP